MIEVLALASAVSGIASSISKAVKAGRDVSSVIPAFGKLATLEAEISLAEKGKHKGPLGKLTSSEAEGLAIAQAKIAHREAVNELRSVCRLYGPANMWETVIFETGKVRKRRAAELKAQALRRDKIFWAISVFAGVAFFLIGTVLMVFGAHTFAG
jgi:hypothetical protein